VFSSNHGTATQKAKSGPTATLNGAQVERRTGFERNGSGRRRSPAEVLDEASFIKLLCSERKRSERSGRSFILMLLEVDSLVKGIGRHDEVDKIVAALALSTRETDITGWHKEASVLGVIFTETGTADRKDVARALLTKVTDALCNTLGVDDLGELRLSFHVFPEDPAKCLGGGPPDSALYPDQFCESDPKRVARIAKRAMDIAGSLFALLLLWPVFLAIAVAVKLTSPGPVLFRQKRVGRYGTTFTFLKFRSMYMANDETIHKNYVTRLISGDPSCSTEAGDVKSFKMRNDPRVTSLGVLLRRTSLDELPQFLNVLRGDMSLVGPRPPIPYEFSCYKTWHRRRLLTVKPGITGLWQVGGRSRVNFDDMVRLDLEYSETWSVWLDLKIVLKTPGAVLMGEGAY
jgi:lipopolysaccharide/colanic/teichoic acid biosynthesis glycosyltransferase